MKTTNTIPTFEQLWDPNHEAFWDTGGAPHQILIAASILIGLGTLIHWFFSKKADSNQLGFGGLLVIASPIMGLILGVILYLFLCIGPFVLVGKGFKYLKNRYHEV